MISTYDTKREQIKNGCFSTGSGHEKVLILGSCRTIPYLNYLAQWNEAGNGMTIRYINPVDWMWDERNERVDLDEVLAKKETDSRVLEVLESSDVFIHEHFGNYAMFNTSRDAEKNIYQFGMKAERDISIPNFHDHYILRNDFASQGDVPENWIDGGWSAVLKFRCLCLLTSFPEMHDHFYEHWRSTRFFWTPNHISSAFSLYIFRLMNEKFLRLSLTAGFWEQIGADDMFSTPCTEVTQEDRDAYGLTWK